MSITGQDPRERVTSWTAVAEDLADGGLPGLGPGRNIPPGPWSPVPPATATLGIFVREGLLSREVRVAGHWSLELLGPGDVIDPWMAESPASLLPVEVRWAALTPVELVLLDAAALARVHGNLAVLAALLARSECRAERLAVHQAISQLPHVELRLLALFCHLAERWGRVGRDGVLVPLDLTHQTLGRLVGARRPTVTLALQALRESGALGRREDGVWVLSLEVPARLAGDSAAAPRSRGPRVKTSRHRTAPAGAPGDLFRRIDELRHAFEASRAAFPNAIERRTRVLQRSEELRQALRRERAG